MKKTNTLVCIGEFISEDKFRQHMFEFHFNSKSDCPLMDMLEEDFKNRCYYRARRRRLIEIQDLIESITPELWQLNV